MGFYAQKKFQTAPVQAVTEPSLASNSSTNVPTIEAVNKGLSAKQLLINNDFQINQRGQTVYDFSTKHGYTLDMWGITKLKLEKLNSGVKLTNNDTTRHSMYQKFDTILPNGAYTLVTKIIGKTGTPTNQNEPFEMFYYDSSGVQHKGTVITNTGVATLKINDDISQIAIGCPPKCTISIEYIDLFDGDIGYPHVKEDYETALDRCQSKIVRYKGNGLTIAMCSINAKQYIGKITLPKPMKETPAIFWNGNIRVIIDGKDWSIIKSLYVISHDSNILTVSGEITDDYANYRGDIARLYLSEETQDITITCESL